MQKTLGLLGAMLLFVSLLGPTPTFAYETIKHYRTIDAGFNGTSIRSVVMTIGRQFNKSTLNGTIEARVFATSDDMEEKYDWAYPIAAELTLFARDNGDATGKIGSYYPEDSDGANVNLPDAVFRWSDWTNIAGLFVKVVANEFSAEIDAHQPYGLSGRRINIIDPLGLDNMDLPGSVSTSSADKSVQDKELGVVAQYDVTLYGEYSKVSTEGQVKYKVYNQSFNSWIDVWSDVARTSHYMW